MEKLSKHTEFETKYRIEGDKQYQFTQIVRNIPEEYDFIFAQGPDLYYTKPDGSFMRYRKGETDRGGRAEVTFKQKPEGASKNVIRKEVNWRVDKNSQETIHEGAVMMGYKFNFKIYKMCHIYKFKDATLVFYTVIDEGGNHDHFIEIELDEESIHKLTEDRAWAIIRKYEAVLEPLGITYRNRLNKSLYEMYVKDIYKKEENVLPIKQETNNG